MRAIDVNLENIGKVNEDQLDRYMKFVQNFNHPELDKPKYQRVKSDAQVVKSIQG